MLALLGGMTPTAGTGDTPRARIGVTHSDQRGRTDFVIGAAQHARGVLVGRLYL